MEDPLSFRRTLFLFGGLSFFLEDPLAPLPDNTNDFKASEFAADLCAAEVVGVNRKVGQHGILYIGCKSMSSSLEKNVVRKRVSSSAVEKLKRN